MQETEIHKLDNQHYIFANKRGKGYLEQAIILFLLSQHWMIAPGYVLQQTEIHQTIIKHCAHAKGTRKKKKTNKLKPNYQPNII